MPMNLDALTEEALNLPIDGRVVLVEKLLSSLAETENNAVEREHVRQVYESQRAAERGEVKFIEVGEGLRQARAALKK